MLNRSFLGAHQGLLLLGLLLLGFGLICLLILLRLLLSQLTLHSQSLLACHLLLLGLKWLLHDRSLLLLLNPVRVHLHKNVSLLAWTYSESFALELLLSVVLWTHLILLLAWLLLRHLNLLSLLLGFCDPLLDRHHLRLLLHSLSGLLLHLGLLRVHWHLDHLVLHLLPHIAHFVVHPALVLVALPLLILWHHHLLLHLLLVASVVSTLLHIVVAHVLVPIVVVEHLLLLHSLSSLLHTYVCLGS